VHEKAPERTWKQLMSIPAHLRYRVGDLAIVHYEAWEWLKNNSRDAHRIIHPAKWVLDVIPLTRKVWNQPNKPRNNNNRYKDTDFYKPLFRPRELGNPTLAGMRAMSESEPVLLYYLPNDRVMMQVVPPGSRSIMSLSLAASWRISIDEHSPVTSHLFQQQQNDAAPNTTTVDRSLLTN
jgi:hypothetical protein